METSYRDAFLHGAQKYDMVTGSRHIRLIQGLEQGVLEKLFRDIGSSDKSVMDFACGSGRWTAFLRTRFRTTVGVDISPAMIEAARPKCPGVEFVVSDITRDPATLSGRTFDVVTAFRFFKNAEPSLRIEAARAVNRRLPLGGLFVFDLHLNAFSIMGLLAVAMRSLWLDKLLGVGSLTVRTISLGQARSVMHQSGFEIVDYYGMGLLPGRSNFTLLPGSILRPVEAFFTTRKLLRPMAYNLLVFARKTSEAANS